MINVLKLNKSMDGKPILKDLDLNVKTGSIYGLVGPNGSGKSTVIRHLTGILKPDSGEILFDARPVYENGDVKMRIGYIPDDLSFFDSYTLKSASAYYRTIYDRWDDERFNDICRALSLDEKKGRIRSFSKGMKKQAVFALTMGTHPDYLIMDEPIDGLDPIVRRIIWKYVIQDVAEIGMSVLVSSHNLREMEGICDSIGIMYDGHMRMECDLDELKSDIHKVQAAFSDEMSPEERFPELNIVSSVKNGSVNVMIVRDEKSKVESCIKAQNPVLFDILPMTLEEVFVYELGGENYDIEEILM